MGGYISQFLQPASRLDWLQEKVEEEELTPCLLAEIHLGLETSDSTAHSLKLQELIRPRP